MARKAKAARSTKGREFKITVAVGRTKGSTDFVACARGLRIPGKSTGSNRHITGVCARGSNPRMAVAHAFTKISQRVSGRGGHYAGYRSKKRR